MAGWWMAAIIATAQAVGNVGYPQAPRGCVSRDPGPGAIDGNARRESSDTSSRLRAQDDAAATVLKDALRRSPTVNALVADLDCSDLLVFVLTSPEPGDWRGDTRLARAGQRMVFVRLNRALAVNERVAVLAHELQHVTEIAAAPDVVDTPGLRGLLERIGFSTGPAKTRYETLTAQAVEQRARQDIARVR